MTHQGNSEHLWNRREFVGAAALSLAGAALGPALLGAAEEKKAPWAEEPTGPYAPFRMALQSYSLRKFDFQKMIDTAYDLELTYVDLWPEHLPITLPEGEFRRRQRAMRTNMLRRIAYGVVQFTKDHAANRAIFEFAKKVNFYAITANPAPDSFESLDKLVEEFRIAVAIHNHGAEDKLYGTPDLIAKALEGHSKRIGLCIDTGHFQRAGADPVEVVKRFGDRVYAVHVKDVKSEGGAMKDVIVGQGDLDLVGFLRALKGAGFRGGLALEYEADPDDPVPAMKKSLEAVRAAVKKM